MKKFFKPILILFCAAVLLASCKKEIKWIDSLENAKLQANEEEKDILLLFTGSDWDDCTDSFKTAVINTKEFREAFNEEYVFVNLDFSQNVLLGSYIDDDATEEQKAEAEKNMADFDKKVELYKTYSVKKFPAVYFLSKEGYVLDAVPYDPEMTDWNEFDSRVHHEKIKSVKEIIVRIRESKDIEKARAINELFESTEPVFASPLRDLIYDFESLDPEDETGLLNSYRMNKIYFKAYDALRANEDAALVFEQAAKDDELVPAAEDKQNLYSMAAYMLLQKGKVEDEYDYDRILKDLQKAYEADPDSAGSEKLLQQIEVTKTILENDI